MSGDAVDTRDAFLQYLKQGLLQANTPDIQRLSVALYRLLGRGRPVTREQLGEICGRSQERIGQLLGEFPATEWNESGAVVAFGGLSIAPTNHRFVTGGVDLHTWCVLDALFLPEILGKPAMLITHCPASGAELTVELAPGEVRAARPRGAMMSIVAPDRQACCDNLRKAFCNHVSLFRDSDAFVAWSRGREGMGSVTLSEAQLMARQRNASRYPDVTLGA
ncbi:MAG TPA: organomercurial lyase [Stellaceae bacterium]|nr:organomercurial lyase [Stellaceae bacterium]